MPEIAADDADLLTKPEAAALLRLTVRGLECLMARRLVPYFKIGRTVRFRRSVVLHHLETRCLVAARNRC